MTSSLLKKNQHDLRNVESARIILSQPAKYPPGTGLRLWARLVLGLPDDENNLTPQSDSR